MELTTAKKLIEGGIRNSYEPQRWLDLGAGDGLFTRALSILLPPGSTIVAVDKIKAVQHIEPEGKGVSIQQLHLDFISENLPATPADGILMANSLHFVKSKNLFFQKVSEAIKKDGRLIIVEYDTDRGNQWVPYPINYSELKQLALQIGFKYIEKIAETPSIYGNGHIYGAVMI